MFKEHFLIDNRCHGSFASVKIPFLFNGFLSIKIQWVWTVFTSLEIVSPGRHCVGKFKTKFSPAGWAPPHHLIHWVSDQVITKWTNFSLPDAHVFVDMRMCTHTLSIYVYINTCVRAQQIDTQRCFLIILEFSPDHIRLISALSLRADSVQAQTACFRVPRLDCYLQM
jgi:hypothetical protein